MAASTLSQSQLLNSEAITEPKRTVCSHTLANPSSSFKSRTQGPFTFSRSNSVTSYSRVIVTVGPPRPLSKTKPLAATSSTC